jgi:membrane-bound metal-dependent hydrolase YbcI (DUF457 family)
MIFFGHLGIGDAMAAPVRRGLSRSWVLAGTVLPDLIDKPLYYGVAAATGLHGDQLGILRGTRGFGHTWALAALVWAAGRARGSDKLRALALGMATHSPLDFVADLGMWGWNGALHGCVALWPLTGWRFPLADVGLVEHLGAEFQPFLLGAEAVGIMLLIRAYFAARRLKPTPE